MKTRTKQVAQRRAGRASGDARLRALTEHVLEIITVQDSRGRFTYANEAVVRHLGYLVEELLGRNAVDYLHPDDIAIMRERFRNVLATKDNQPERNRFEYRFQRRRFRLGDALLPGHPQAKSGSHGPGLLAG